LTFFANRQENQMGDYYGYVLLCGFLVFGLVIVASVAAVMAGIVIQARRRTVQVHQAWADFARAHGLTFAEGSLFVYPTISGLYRNRSVTISIFVVGSTVSVSYTVTQTTLNVPATTQLQVSANDQTGLYYRTWDGPMLNNIGSDMFGNRYNVRGNSPELALSLLSPTVQAALLDNSISHLRVKDGKLSLRVRGFESRPQVLEAMLDVACGIAEQLDPGR
jgi:hypothetical protein